MSSNFWLKLNDLISNQNLNYLSQYQIRIVYLSWKLKLVSAMFYQNFIFHQMIPLQKLWKMFFISSKKLFLFSRYSDFWIFIYSPIFFPVSHCFRPWFKKNPEVYDLINCLNKNLVKHYIWYLEKEIRSDIETLSVDGVLIQNIFMLHQKLAPHPFLILLNNSKKTVHARNSF